MPSARGWDRARFARGDIHDPAPGGPFDVIVERLALTYVPDPAVVLRRQATRLRAGGRVVAIEFDFATARVLPATPLASQALSWLIEAFPEVGIPSLGPRPWSVLSEAGSRHLGRCSLRQARAASTLRRGRMTTESLSATTTIEAPVEAVFSVLADPTNHVAIDAGSDRPQYGVGGVLEAIDRKPLTASGQVFRMAMYHPNHPNPNGRYETANRVRVLDSPHAISWETGYEADDGSLRFAGWVWRYDLTPVAPSTT